MPEKHWRSYIRAHTHTTLQKLGILLISNKQWQSGAFMPEGPLSQNHDL